MDKVREKKTAVIILKTFFGYRPGHETLKDFNEEIKALSAQEKEELALLCAKELGFDVVEYKREAA